jgi:quercetin dioxygenase-like cupin family protein
MSRTHFCYNPQEFAVCRSYPISEIKGECMNFIKSVQDHVGVNENKFYKTTLFHSDALLLGINCLEPGQVQKPHEHAGQDKFYFVVEGHGEFQIGDDIQIASAGQMVWAPAGVIHGVSNEADSRLTLLVGIAPAP